MVFLANVRGSLIKLLNSFYMKHIVCLLLRMSLKVLSSQYKEINSWWNSVYHKIFNYSKWDSVSELIFYLERLDYKSLCNIKKCNFLERLVTSSNLVISNFLKFYLNSKKFFVFACKTGLNINMSGSKIKFTMNKRRLNKVFV